METAFERDRISVIYDVPINEITPDEVLSADKHRINYGLLTLFPPFGSQASLNNLNASEESDFIKVNSFMRVQGHDNTYAAGDIVSFPGPKFAHMAVRQGNVAADGIISAIKGTGPEYRHEIATVIDAGGPDSTYLHYGIWDDARYSLKKGRFWSVAKNAHDAVGEHVIDRALTGLEHRRFPPPRRPEPCAQNKVWRLGIENGTMECYGRQGQSVEQYTAFRVARYIGPRAAFIPHSRKNPETERNSIHSRRAG